MNIFTFGNCSTKIIYIIICCIIILVREYTFETFGSKYKPKKIILLFLMCIGQFLPIVLVIIEKIRAEKLYRKTKKISDEIFSNRPRERPKINYKLCALGIIAGVADGFGYGSDIILPSILSNKPAELNTIPCVSIIFNFISTALFNYLICKVPLYKHHYFSFFLLFIGTIINIIISKYLSSIRFNFFLHFGTFFNGIWNTLLTYLIVNKLVSIYTTISLAGLGAILFTLLIMIILNFVKCFSYLSNKQLCVDGQAIFPIKESFDDLSTHIGEEKTLVIRVILYIVLSMLLSVYLCVIFKYYSPTHRYITIIYKSFMVLIINIIQYRDRTLLLELISGYIFMIFGTIFYNETIIINACKLNENTRIQISKRANEESTIVEMYEILDHDSISDSEFIY